MTERDTMTKDDRQAMMKSMMEQFFGGMGMDEKKEMCAAMMGKMTEGLDMKEMMPRMMMGMMSGGEGPGAGAGPAKKPDMMAKMMGGGAEGHMAQMPEMMLGKMMPHCIGMMLPAIDPDKRGDVAAEIVSALAEKGIAGMSEAQAKAFRETLGKALRG